MPTGKQMELVKTYCIHCNCVCGVVCRVENGRFIEVKPDSDHPNGGICVKGEAAPQLVYAPDRLRYPMRRTKPKTSSNPGWERITWDEALETIAARLKSIKENFGPEAVVLTRAAVGGSPIGDLYFWLIRLANAFGTPNFQDNTHVCQWARDTGSMYTYGRGIPSPDFENSSCILIWGHNPHISLPSYARRIERAQDKGAKLIVVDPRRTALASQADLWLRVRPGTDGALALGMVKVILEERLYDGGFVRDWTNGPFLIRCDTGSLLRQSDLEHSGSSETFAVWDTIQNGPAYYTPADGYLTGAADPALEGMYQVELASGERIDCCTAFQSLMDLVSQYSPARTEEVTWVEAEKVELAARLFATARPVSYYTYVGIEEHTNSMMTNRAICVLYALTGNFDKRGGNVIFPNLPINSVAGREFLSREKAAIRLGGLERPLGPSTTAGSVQGYDVYNAILDGKPYPVKAIVAFGGDILLSNGDSIRGREALRQLDFYAHVDLFENSSNRLADILLPASSFWEWEHVRPTFHFPIPGGEATSCYLQLRKRVIQPLYESWPDIEIIFALADRLGLGDKFWRGDIQEAYSYQLAPTGFTIKDLKDNPGGIHAPIPVQYEKYAQKDLRTGKCKGFATPSKRIEIYSETFVKHGYNPLPTYQEPYVSPVSTPDLAKTYPLILTMSKLAEFCHTQHRNIPALRKLVPYPFAEINPGKAKELGISDGDWVTLETPHGAIRVKAKFNDGIDPRVVCIQHGWWQPCPDLGLAGFDPFSSAGANANLLISNDFVDAISGSVPHRSYLCTVRKAE